MYYVKVENNLKIAVEDLNKAGRKTVLFIHGWPLSRKIFEYQYGRLTECDYRCVAMDLRGFGDSDCADGGYCYDRLAKDMLEVIKSLDANEVTLAGFSVGGAIAIRYMSLFGGYGVNKLALIGAAAPSFVRREGYPYGMTREDVDRLIYQAGLDRPRMVSDFGAKLFASAPSAQLRAWVDSIGLDASGIGTVKLAESLRDEDLRSELCNIRVQTGIFHGERDLVCPFAFALELLGAIPNSQLYPFKHSGHAVFYDELETFNECFLHFLCQSE